MREPISQIISLIFQQLNLYNLDKLEELDIENKQINYDYPTYWCNSELEHFCGINVLSEPFDCQKGYAIYNNGKFSVLVIRYENITQIFEEAMTEFTGIQGWNLSRRNVSSNKSYAKEYKEFKNRVKIAPEVLQKINSSLYVKHFYPE